MKLYEALRASKCREAVGFLPNGRRCNLRGVSLGIPVANACDGGVELIDIDENGVAGEIRQLHWTTLLPKDLTFVQSLDWHPIDPKPPLRQLADAMTDFSEVDETKENDDVE